MKMRQQCCCFVIFSSLVQVMADPIVYTNYQREAGTEYLVVIGAIFPVHSSVNGSCGPIRLSAVQYVEALSYVTQLVNSGLGPLTLRGVKL